MEAWRLGKTWKGLEKLRGFEYINHNQGLPKMRLRASKIEPRGLLNGPPGPLKWHQVGPKSNITVAWRLLSTPREPRRALVSGLGAPRAAKMGAKRLQDTPKSYQNGADMGSKWGLKPVQHRIRF